MGVNFSRLCAQCSLLLIDLIHQALRSALDSTLHLEYNMSHVKKSKKQQLN